MNLYFLRGWIVSSLALMLVGGAVGCKQAQPKPDEEGTVEGAPLVVSDPSVQADLERALEQLEGGDFEGAAEAFGGLGEDDAQEGLAAVAELYRARAALGDLSAARFEGGGGAKPPSAALESLSVLADHRGVAEEVAYSARVYLAMGQAIAGNSGQGAETLADYPSASLSRFVLAGDRALAYLVLAEALQKAGRPSQALSAYAALWKTLTGQYEEVGAAGESGAAGVVEAWRALARARAFAIAGELSEADLQDHWAAGGGLGHAVAGWGLLRGMMEQAPLGEASQRAADQLFARVAPRLIEVGGGDRAAELSVSMAATAGPRRYAIGVVVPMGGAGAGVGAKIVSGALMAAGAFELGGPPTITVVFQDSAQPAGRVFDQFEAQSVSGVVGPMDGSRASEYAEEARRREIPMIALTTQSVRELLEPEGGDGERASFVFRHFVDPRAEARAGARLVMESAGATQAAIVYPNVGYGRTMAEAFGETFEGMGGQVVAELEYDRASSDFAAVAEQLAASDPEVVFVPDSGAKVSELTAFFANANVWGYGIHKAKPRGTKRTYVWYVGTSLWKDEVLLTQARSYVEGAVIPTWFGHGLGGATAERFSRRYEAVYGQPAQAFEAFAFDSVSLLKSLMLERGISQPSMLRDALLDASGFQGVVGGVWFGRGGEAMRRLGFVVPAEGGFEALGLSADATEGGPSGGVADEAEQADDAAAVPKSLR